MGRACGDKQQVVVASEGSALMPGIRVQDGSRDAYEIDIGARWPASASGDDCVDYRNRARSPPN
jgi:hypothetical protein